MVAREPHREVVNWTVESDNVGVRIGVMSRVVRVKPGGIVVVAGQ